MIRQAIETKYLGATNHRGSRVKARAAAGSIMVEWDHSLDVEKNHIRAAEALMIKFGWKADTLATGEAANGHGYVHVLVKKGQDND